jgi:hypothetical protein
LVILGFGLLLASCTQRMICPAYQSAFIYDKDELRKKFSYFQDDSIPKVLTASKNKYLVAEPISYRKKIRTMQTVAMKPVPVKVPDSLTEEGDVSLAELDMAARSVMDTIVASGYQAPPDSTKQQEDSVYVITKDKELRLLKYDPDSIKYRVVDVRLNVDQDNYMWYLRDYLILPDVRLAKMNQNAEAKAEKAEKKGIKGFFKNLFKRKKKTEEIDSAALAPPPEEDEFDYVDEDTAQVKAPAPPPPQKKKGLFSFLKKDKSSAGAKNKDVAPADKPKKEKKKKEKKKKEDAPVKEEQEEEEKDDGF